MEYIILFLCLIAIILLVVFGANKHKSKGRYNRRGFDRNRVHKNGTKFDEYGYDYFGYDKDGYDQQGYNKFGKNEKGQYDRFFDTTSWENEGFYNPKEYPIALSTHARERFCERLGIYDAQKMDMQTLDAYRFGKSKCQIKKTSSYLVDEIEQKHENSVVLIYRNTIYIFSCDNVLKTLYKNDKIPL